MSQFKALKSSLFIHQLRSRSKRFLMSPHQLRFKHVSLLQSVLFRLIPFIISAEHYVNTTPTSFWGLAASLRGDLMRRKKHTP